MTPPNSIIPIFEEISIDIQKSPWIFPKGLIVLYDYELFHILNSGLWCYPQKGVIKVSFS